MQQLGRNTTQWRELSCTYSLRAHSAGEACFYYPDLRANFIVSRDCYLWNGGNPEKRIRAYEQDHRGFQNSRCNLDIPVYAATCVDRGCIGWYVFGSVFFTVFAGSLVFGMLISLLMGKSSEKRRGEATRRRGRKD